MPVTIPGMMGVLIPNLVSSGMIGTGVPKYAQAIATGLSIWVPQVKILTVDTGTLGVGLGVPVPLIVPVPVLYANLVSSMIAQGLAGPLMPALMAGLATGLASSFGQMVTQTNHPTVGLGGGVATFRATPATPSMLLGFSSVGMSGSGPTKKARALGSALDRIFASLIMPVGIVGPPSIAPSGGAGFGNIV